LLLLNMAKSSSFMTDGPAPKLKAAMGISFKAFLWD
jgi:hypothetical protein